MRFCIAVSLVPGEMRGIPIVVRVVQFLACVEWEWYHTNSCPGVRSMGKKLEHNTKRLGESVRARALLTARSQQIKNVT